MIEHPNSLLVHQCLQAANVGDRQTLKALWADDIVWHVKGAGPWQGDIKGAEDIFDYLAELGEVGTVGFHTEIEDVMVSHRRAAVICISSGDMSPPSRWSAPSSCRYASPCGVYFPVSSNMSPISTPNASAAPANLRSASS